MERVVTKQIILYLSYLLLRRIPFWTCILHFRVNNRDILATRKLQIMNKWFPTMPATESFHSTYCLLIMCRKKCYNRSLTIIFIKKLIFSYSITRKLKQIDIPRRSSSIKIFSAFQNFRKVRTGGNIFYKIKCSKISTKS